MATFLPPVLDAATMFPPTRAALDATGHRTALIARFSGAQVRAIAPCDAFAKPVSIAGDLAGAVADGARFWFAEFDPIPAPATAAQFLALGMRGTGMPRFLIGGSGIDGTFDARMFSQGEPLSITGDVFVGATLGVCALAPREWARILVEVMAGEAGLDGWMGFRDLLGAGRRALYILNHAGQVPAPLDLAFQIETGVGDLQVSLGASGDLEADLRLADPSLSLFDPGRRMRLALGAGGIPYHTAYDPGLRSAAEHDAADDARWFTPGLFEGGRSGTVLCTDLDGWFGERPEDIPLRRYHTGNHVVGLVDGEETFAALGADLDRLLAPLNLSADDDNVYGAWLASWAFKNIRLRPDRPGRDPEPLFVDLIKNLASKDDVSVRVLATKLVNFEGTESAEEKRLMLVAILLWVWGLDGAYAISRAFGKPVSVGALAALGGLGVLMAVVAHPMFVDFVTDKVDGSKEVVEKLTPADPGEARFALWSRYPARFSDNPASSQNVGGLTNALAKVKRLGVWHSKMQLLSLTSASSETPEYVGYVGGVDINENRIDTWGHGWPGEYHDVHARITGPAVADLFQSFYERYLHEMEHRRPEDGTAAPNTCPCVAPRVDDGDAVSLAPIEPTGDDIVQIARTIYRPHPQNAAEAFWFAPHGEASAHDSILRAIRSAREYIYIEDQFMAPPDSGGTGEEILEALVEAAQRCRALVLVFPEGTGDPQWRFGVERRNMLIHKLKLAWGEPGAGGRHFLPLIHVRPLLDRPDPIASFGRTVLKTGIDEIAQVMTVADGIRVPKAPCWAWVEGELVLVRDVAQNTLAGTAALTVDRGTQARHLSDSWVRTHRAGAPVTFARLDDVFIHAKMMLVDDVYASIGSVNMSRRSMYHDGEISAQIVPGQLRAAAVNPVRDVRCRVWADHLGIAPDMALAALADPLDAIPLFMRARAAGNTMVAYDMLDDLKPPGLLTTSANVVAWLGMIFGDLGVGDGDNDLLRRAIYSTIVDPTTALDPFFDVDPFPGFNP